MTSGNGDCRTMLTAVSKLCGQSEIGPRLVLVQSNRRIRSPISPPVAIGLFVRGFFEALFFIKHYVETITKGFRNYKKKIVLCNCLLFHRILVTIFIYMQNLDPKVIVIFFIKSFLGTVYILPIWFIGIFIFEKVWPSGIAGLSEDVVIFLLDSAGIIFLALLAGIAYSWSWLQFVNFMYELQTDGFHIKSGVILRRHIIIAYTDIESVDVYVNPFVARTLNLFSLNIKTRDLENTEGIFKKKTSAFIPGLASEVARDLRSQLLEFSHVNKVKKPFQTTS